jgi:hypothetical protein
MTWIALIPLISQFGLPFAEQLWTLVQSNAAPTAADWAALKALTATTSEDEMMKVLLAHNIDPNSPAGVALLALT